MSCFLIEPKRYYQAVKTMYDIALAKPHAYKIGDMKRKAEFVEFGCQLYCLNVAAARGMALSEEEVLHQQAIYAAVSEENEQCSGLETFQLLKTLECMHYQIDALDYANECEAFLMLEDAIFRTAIHAVKTCEQYEKAEWG